MTFVLLLSIVPLSFAFPDSFKLFQTSLFGRLKGTELFEYVFTVQHSGLSKADTQARPHELWFEFPNAFS